MEGKPTTTCSPHAKSIQGQQHKDENLNNEFRCQYCSQFFDSRVTLELHLECEHNFADRVVAAQQQNSSPRMSPEETSQHQQQFSSSEQQQQSIGPMNLSGLSIRNFAQAANASWLQAGQTPQLQTPSEQQASSLAKMAAARNNNHFPPMPAGFPGPLAPFLPMPGFPLPDSAQIQRAAMGQFPKIFNPDAYCDLCNKEFCNKYFLKTHKANKHGIYVDPPASQPQGSDSTPSNPFLTTSSPIGNLPGALSMKMMEPSQSNGMQQQQQQQQQPTLPCDMCPKRFKNDDSLRKHRQKIHLNPNNESSVDSTQMNIPSSSVDDERQSPGGMETLFKQEYNIDHEEISYSSTPKSVAMSPPTVQQLKETALNGDRLRRLGVMNPEAFCELCCKEYCNKYFLRTHKLKKHGIFIPDNDKSPNAPSSAASWHQVQTSPLNLIMSDSLGNGSESGDRTEEYACRTCGIRFQTQDLFHLHMEKIHDTEEQSSPKPEPDDGPIDQRTDSISEDLQKLQTMILQLNGMESNKAASCALCGKDYDTPSALRSHMVSEHGVIPENFTSSQSQQQLAREKSSPTAIATPAFCTICEREFPSQEILRKHIAEDHQPSTPTSSTPQLPPSVPTTPKSNASQPTERKATASITPTSSYCEICNKELCNKYFMKTHMQKMHGIEIENGAQIGGVICNICKKELCSKYFLRVHKQNTHGIVEEGASSAKQDNFESPPNADDVALKPEQLGDLNLRYITHFTEVCPICNRRFRSPKWLKVHLQSEHGKAGVDKWREIEQYHQSLPKTPARVPSISKNSQQQQTPGSTSLRIPNGFEANQQIRADLAALGNQVLSNFFGGGSTDDQQAQTYRCSQPNCNFSTSILPLFFLHERSHSHAQDNPVIENERLLQCPICAQTFSQPEILRQHIASRHPSPFPGLLSQFPLPLLNDFALSNEQPFQHQERADYSDSKEDLRQPSPQIMNEIDTNKMKSPEENAVQVMPQGAYKCSQCGFATANLNRIKKHIKKDHKSLGDPAETALAELSKTLKDMANKHRFPASYAMPQDNSNSLSPDKTIMQPFIIEELDNPTSQNNGNCTDSEASNGTSSKRFAPALVFLPVKTRVSGSLTISFTLNPAWAHRERRVIFSLSLCVLYTQTRIQIQINTHSRRISALARGYWFLIREITLAC